MQIVGFLHLHTLRTGHTKRVLITFPHPIMAHATLETTPAIDTVEAPQMPEQREQAKEQEDVTEQIRVLTATYEEELRDIIAKVQEEEEETAVVEASRAMAA